jgi:hypothetical protein
MTSKPSRPRGGQSTDAKAKAAAETEKAAPADAAPDQKVEQKADAAPAEKADTADKPEGQPGDAPTGDAPQARAGALRSTDPVPPAEPVADVLHIAGNPTPATVSKNMVRNESGVSPAANAGVATVTAPTGDTDRNGRPINSTIDTTGALRTNPPAAAPAHPQPSPFLAGDGVRAQIGAGTLNPTLPADTRPTYPDVTVTRASSSATPMEPSDVTHVTEPKLGVVQGSTDPVMAASAMRSAPGDVLSKLVNTAGATVKPSEFFEVPEGVEGRGFRRVKYNVSEVFTVRHTKSPGRRKLFIEGQLVPQAQAETLVSLYG